MKKFLIILIIIFICGVLSADICMKQIQESDAVVGLEYYKQYANTKLIFKDVFWSILYDRLKLFVGIGVLCFTPLKERIGFIIVPLFSFVWGFYLMSCIIELGVAGLAVGLASVLPHGILYVSGVGLLLGHKRRKYYMKNSLVADAGIYIFIFILGITGCIIESLVATHFIPWVIRLSLI